MVVSGQSGCIGAKVDVFGQKCWYSGKVVVFGKIDVFGESISIRAKVVVFGQGGCNRLKVFVVEKKWFHSGKRGCIISKWL